MNYLLLTHTIAIVLGLAGGFFIASIFAAEMVRKAEKQVWREAERLHRARSLQDLRDQATTLGLCPESMAGPVREQAPPMPESLRNLTR